MPIYTYQCTSCGIQFEKMQKFADKPLTRCPECRTGRVRRVVGPPAIVFKGSGWYTTDHRSSSSGGRSGSKPASTDKDKSESKPESKPEAKPAAGSDD